jgi:hypothetical protein
MKKAFAIVAVVVLAVMAVRVGSQEIGAIPPINTRKALQPEHAVLPDQCRADVHLWYSQSKNEKDNLSFSQLQQRSSEMLNCMTIDSGQGETVGEFERDSRQYEMVLGLAQGMARNRLQNYIQRHGENQQFLDEDAAGLR